MKKLFFILLVTGASSVAFAKAPVPEKAIQSFRVSFPHIQDAKWHESAEFYEAYFEKDDIKCRVRYDFSGQLLSTRRDYTADKLCPFMRGKVTEKFQGKSIFGITEINDRNEMFYVIVLEDDKGWTYVKADPTGQMEVTQKLMKSK